MAYTSDFRFKNFVKEIDIEVGKQLSKLQINERPQLRLFEESYEDSILFEDGGLTFKDKETNLKYGSNDAAWVYKNDPILVVEGTYSTERGQFGDGQLNRFSHSVGVAVNGHIGLTLLPFKGESYSKTGFRDEKIKSNINLKYAYLHKGFVKGAIHVCEKEKGEMLLIDIYDKFLICELLINIFKKKIKLENEYNVILNKIKLKMSNQIKDFEYASNSNQFLRNLYNSKKILISNFSRYYSHNFSALTDSSKRDGHGLLGKNILESYLSGDEKYYSIFIRMTQKDIDILTKRNQKEFKYIANSKNIVVKCFDDLIFHDENLKNEIIKIKNVNLFQNRNTDLMKKIQKAFLSKEILINETYIT